MAKATAKTETKTICTTTFNLELDADEAQFLHDVLMYVGGSPSTSRRRYADVIRAALQKTYALKDTTGSAADRSGSISFSG